MTTGHMPTPTQDRIKVIDVVRGFALFGVFLVNTAMFNSTLFESSSSALDNPWLVKDGLEWFSALFIQVLGEGKFYTIFSFLFGLGFFLFEKRAEEKGFNAKALFKRRLGFLFLFGLFNFSLVWHGDILHAYALIGFCMIPFYKCEPKKILIWAVSLLTLFILLYGVLSIADDSKPTQAPDTTNVVTVDEGDKFIASLTERMTKVYHKGNYFEIVSFRLSSESWLVLVSLFFIGPKILGMFLLGLYVGKKDWIPRLADHKPQLKRFLIITGLLALGTTGFYVSLQAGVFGPLDMSGKLLFQIIKELNIVIMASAYASGIAYLHVNGKFANLFYRLGCVGQMALTNYLVQCILLSWLFYGHGLGLMNFLPLGGGIIITIIFFGIQLIYSTQWLKHHKQGPCEKLWRKMTYAKVIRDNEVVQ